MAANNTQFRANDPRNPPADDTAVDARAASSRSDRTNDPLSIAAAAVDDDAADRPEDASDPVSAPADDANNG